MSARGEIRMHCPMLMDTLVIADDARLAAQLSCRLSRPGCYLPVIDGPRLTRPDRHAEVLRRNNAAARAQGKVVYLAGLSTDAVARLSAVIPKSAIRTTTSPDQPEALPGG